MLPDLILEQIAKYAKTAGFSCVELMCRPKGKAERRNSGRAYEDSLETGKAALNQNARHIKPFFA